MNNNLQMAELPMPPHGLMGLLEKSSWTSGLNLWFTLGLLLLLAAVIYFRNLQQRQQQGSQALRLAAGQPAITLLEELRALTAPEHAEQQEEFFFRLGFLLREALENVTGRPFTDWTRLELKAEIGRLNLPPGIDQAEFFQFCDLADRVKFQGIRIHRDELLAAHKKVLSWVEGLVAPELARAEGGSV